jgi:hypothetical protein
MQWPIEMSGCIGAFEGVMRSIHERMHPAAGSPGTPERDIAALVQLAHTARELPRLFEGARRRAVKREPDSALAAGDKGALLAGLLEGRRLREASLLLVRDCLSACERCLGESLPFLTPGRQRHLETALGTLAVEYVRLLHAGRMHFARNERQLASGEPDDDPEFSQVLEKTIYATDEDDEFADSIAQASGEIARVVAAITKVPERRQ